MGFSFTCYKKYVKIAKNQIQNLQIKNKEVYKILLESQLPVKEKPIAYTKWGKCLKKDRMHTLTCITQIYFSHQSKNVCNFLFFFTHQTVTIIYYSPLF
jgi:hypothetical protein